MKILRVILVVVFFYTATVFLQAAVEKKGFEPVSPSAQVLLGKLFSPVEKERVNAALRLGDYSHPNVVNALCTSAEKDLSEMVKRVALKSLGQIGDPVSLPLILKSISSESLSIKTEAMGAAVNFDSLQVRDAIIRESAAANPVIRQKAVAYLGRLKKNNNQVIDILIEKLLDISEGVRVSAAVVLGEKQILKAIPFLGGVLAEDKSEVVRRYAAEALGNIANPVSEEFLKKALADNSPFVRMTAAKSLSLNGSNAGLGEAIQGTKSTDARIRIIACEVLGISGSMESIIFLEQASRDFDRRVQKAAVKALKQVMSKE
ncbi:MAG: HEAT repeat domain-containing protein [Elusimicrobiota bacterium]